MAEATEIATGGLLIGYVPDERPGGKDEGREWTILAGWTVELPGRCDCVLLFGFGRRKDAEIAAQVLCENGIDPTLPLDELKARWYGGGGVEGWTKKVGEHLQW